MNFGFRNSDLLCLAVLGSVVVLTGVGCNSLQKKHENPVLSQAPVRVSHIEPDEDAKLAEATPDHEPDITDPEIQPVGGFKADPWADWKDDTAIFNSKVAATVNGVPVLNGDVLDRYSQNLIQVREAMQKQKVPPDQYEKYRESLIQRDIIGHIQRRLLVERMRSSMKPDQIKSINGQLDAQFEREVEKLKRELKVSTRTELELELNKKGTTIQNVKDNFVTEQMAMGYFQSKIGKPEHIDRMDLVEYYQSHLDDFAVKANVQWEQIQVSFGEQRSESDAKTQIDATRREVESGIPFADVAAKYSDGPTAKSGGLWEPMEQGNLADTKLEKMLFEIPVGELSPIHKGPSEFQLVRVLLRKPAGRTPFPDVQDEIKKKIEFDQNRDRPKKLLQKLFSEAIIETTYVIPDLKSGL